MSASHASDDSESLDRGQWSGKFDFLMSMIAYAVGLGNIWRFPYLCFKNGGGAFLVVYGIFFALGAVPIFVMEVTIGQYVQRGAMEVWTMCPLFKGVGIGNVMISFMCIAYFCVIISWAMYYMLSSFNATFPWETCDNWWNDKATCLTGNENASVVRQMMIALNGTANIETSVEQFWERRVLMQSNSIADFGGIQWELFALTLFSWVLVYFALWKGITQARKFVYFCALFPYFLLAILLIRGLTLPGAFEGVKYYLMPNLTALTHATVWKDAGTQVFYSYGVGFGALIALGSHNKFNHNCFRLVSDVIKYFLKNIRSCFAVFSVLGYMSHKTLKPIGDIVKGGVGLAFQAYPEVATKLPGKQFWSVLFFLMITIIGLDSQVCMLEGLFTAIEDVYPSVFRKYKKISLLVTCITFFIIGIPMVSYAGTYWLTLFDGYGASGIALLFVVICEVVGLSWGFGADNVRGALKTMINLNLSIVWNYIWKYNAPMVTTMLLIFCIWQYTPEKTLTGEDYPRWAQIFGFFLASCSMGGIPLYAVYYLCKCKGTLREVNFIIQQLNFLLPLYDVELIEAGRNNGKLHESGREIYR
ncbi:unnamed protein product [Enterobius vermicularis]|uniref:Transporter n=1 Tax=Enterobius vermicularis TaxID=51028 RepID=A0A0N4V869_ENTVE|nr:unnamed protein product [Enterobius vermicularis]